jgi:hypothetical protein
VASALAGAYPSDTGRVGSAAQGCWEGIRSFPIVASELISVGGHIVASQ